jgi:hypothetical protein
MKRNGRSSRDAESARRKFDAIRREYLSARDRFREHEDALRAKYGPELQRSWLGAGERSRLDRLSDAKAKAGDAFYEHVRAMSPRDWGSGVPYCWVLESLTYEDAVRPAGEKLSVTPPLPFGATEHLR